MSVTYLKQSFAASMRFVGLTVSGDNEADHSDRPDRYSLGTPPPQHVSTRNVHFYNPPQTKPMFRYDDRTLSLPQRWSNDRFDDMARLWKLTPEERGGMRKLQLAVADVDHWKNDPYEIVRYYREFKGQAERKFRAMIKWRLEEGIEDHLGAYGNPDPLFDYMPIGLLQGADKEGDPVYIDRMGMCDSWGLLKEFKTEGMVDYLVYINELLNTRSIWKDYEEKAGRRVSQFTVLIDLGGLNAGHMRPGLLPLLQKISRITQDNYSGWAKRIILLRAPSIFHYIWKFVKHFFDPHIRDLIVVTTQSNYMDLTSEHIDLRVLPPSVAPNVGEGGGLAGYFDHIQWEAGPIPSREKLGEILKARERKSLEKEKGSGASMPKLTRQDSETSTVIGSLSSRPSTLSSRPSRRSVLPRFTVYGGSMLKGYWREAPETVEGKFFVVWPSKDAVFNN